MTVVSAATGGHSTRSRCDVGTWARNAVRSPASTGPRSPRWNGVGATGGGYARSGRLMATFGRAGAGCRSPHTRCRGRRPLRPRRRPRRSMACSRDGRPCAVARRHHCQAVGELDRRIGNVGGRVAGLPAEDEQHRNVRGQGLQFIRLRRRRAGRTCTPSPGFQRSQPRPRASNSCAEARGLRRVEASPALQQRITIDMTNGPVSAVLGPAAEAIACAT